LKRASVVLAILCFVATMCASVTARAQVFANIPQFSGDINITPMSAPAAQGKMYFGGKRVRIDMNMRGRETSMIVDSEKQTTYMMMPQQKMYMEMHASNARSGGLSDVKPFDANNPCANNPETTCTKEGTETVNGRTCDRWLLTKGTEKRTLWLDKKLHFPIKTVSAEGSTMEMTNIKEGGQDASLFEVPAGYQKIEMGGGMRPNQ